MGNYSLFADIWLVIGVFVPMILWLIIAIIFVWRLMRKYPLGTWGKDEENPYKTETMGLPRGLIRGVLTISLLVGAIVLQIYAIRFLESGEKISPFMGAFEIMLAFYFGSKVVHHLGSVDKNKARAKAEAEVQKYQDNDFNDPDAIG